MRPGRVALGVCVPHLRAPYAFETALSHSRRPTIGVRASGMSMPTRSTGRPQSFREDDSSSLGSGWEAKDARSSARSAEAKAAEDARRAAELKAAEEARRVAKTKAAGNAPRVAKSKAAKGAPSSAATHPGKTPEEMPVPPADLTAPPRGRRCWPLLTSVALFEPASGPFWTARLPIPLNRVMKMANWRGSA
jgi:hypothetical protein